MVNLRYPKGPGCNTRSYDMEIRPSELRSILRMGMSLSLEAASCGRSCGGLFVVECHALLYYLVASLSYEYDLRGPCVKHARQD